MERLSFRFVYDKNKRATAFKPQPLYVEARRIGTNQTVYINTEIKLYPNQFSDKNGFTCKNHDKANLVTVRAKKIFAEIEAFAVSEKCRKLEDIKYYNQEKVQDDNVIDFIQKELRKSNPTLNVVTRHNVLINHLVKYGKITTFSSLSYENIEGFDIHLKKTMNAQSTVYRMHSILRVYINKAIKMGVCGKSPYDDFKISKGKDLSEPVFLIEEEIQLIKNMDCENEKLERVRDLFIFQCYTGLAYVDLMSFSMDWVYETDGYKVFRDKRKKTGEGFFSILFPEAENILKKYNGKLPKISNQKYNDYLKLIQIRCGIKKKIVSQTGRHSAATLLLNKGVPITTVSRVLGHSNLKQTQHYARLLAKTVVSDMAKLIDNPTILTGERIQKINKQNNE